MLSTLLKWKTFKNLDNYVKSNKISQHFLRTYWTISRFLIFSYRYKIKAILTISYVFKILNIRKSTFLSLIVYILSTKTKFNLRELIRIYYRYKSIYYLILQRFYSILKSLYYVQVIVNAWQYLDKFWALFYIDSIIVNFCWNLFKFVIWVACI